MRHSTSCVHSKHKDAPRTFAADMFKRSHRYRTWKRRIAWYTALCFAMLIVAGNLYQLVSLGHDRQTYPMPGRLVDVGGYRMHLYCIGEAGPTVVLDSGLGDSFVEWKRVQGEVSTFARVCSYDRAGMGYSDWSPQARNSAFFARELHELLHRASISPPYILVGHSMAAFNIRLYASFYPNDVAGLVFVDGSHPDQLERFPPALHAMNARWIREGRLWQLVTPLGLARLLGYCGDDPEVRGVECTYNDARESADERSSFRKSAALVKETIVPSGLPLLVISHDPKQRDSDLSPDLNRETNAAWAGMQEDLVRLSSKGTRIIATDSGHYIQNDRPDVVITGIRGMVDRVEHP
jgi:pimeloyl-ACP methyl ester carboxylesterase